MERLIQKLRIQKRRIADNLENSFNDVLNIFQRSGPRAPDPDPETKSAVILGVQAQPYLSTVVSNKYPWFKDMLAAGDGLRQENFGG